MHHVLMWQKYAYQFVWFYALSHRPAGKHDLSANHPHVGIPAFVAPGAQNSALYFAVYDPSKVSISE